MSSGVQETLRIATPEGVSLELSLAGVGSRFVALLLDTLLQGLAFIALVIVMVIVDAGGFTADALIAVAVFALVFVYPVAFELGAAGRTPGKRWSSLRVVCDDGSPVTVRASALRNLVRPVDALPGMYLVGAIAIFASSGNQRLGDMAAGTIVVREPRAPKAARQPVAPPAAAVPAPLTEELPAWDASGLTGMDLVALRRFLERRHDLGPVPRTLLARDLAERLRPGVGGVGDDIAPERFLELIAALRGVRS